ncbi:sensor histidine kinase [Nitrobacter sp.]|uniref:sensor histidine kinase n=1 Tax=Nitrobacter sp. TaxID=29420 RepID=UPI003F652F62
MANWIEEFRHGWQGVSEPPAILGLGLAAVCLTLSTAFRFGISMLRPDVPYSPYLPAVFVAAAFGGERAGIAAAVGGAILGLMLDFGGAAQGLAAAVLIAVYSIVSALVILGIRRHRSLVTHYRELTARLDKEQHYREFVVRELQHRLGNKLATIHAVIRQALHDYPAAWNRVDSRMRALSATDDLIASTDGRGCDIIDLLKLELGPYGNVRFTLDGDPLFLPAKLAVSLALMFHELATNAAKYGAFSTTHGLLHVSWTVTNDILSIVWDESGGPTITAPGKPGFGTQLLNIGLRPFNGKSEIAFLRTGLHCMMQCRIETITDGQ